MLQKKANMAAIQFIPLVYFGRCLYAFTILVIVTLVPSQELHGLVQDTRDARVETAEGRQLLILPVSTPESNSGTAELRTQLASVDILAQSFESPSHRTHVVYVEGAEHRAVTPLQGPGAWIAFDPARRRFESLLPSIRVELVTGRQLDAVVETVGAPNVEVFSSLGFTILYLPSNLHPADAVVLARRLPSQTNASLRLRRPQIEWR